MPQRTRKTETAARTSGGPGGGTGDAAAFRETVTGVMTELSAALNAVLAGRGGLGLKGGVAADLRRCCDIDTKLSTQIVAVARAENPVAAGKSVPGARSMGRFLRVVAERGVPESTVQRVQKAYGRFEAAVARFAGDRSSFDTMLAEAGGEPQSMTSGAVDLTHRRAAYRAMSHVLGAQCELQVKTLMFHYDDPSGGPGDGLMSAVDLNLFRGLRRLRADAMVCLFRNKRVERTNLGVMRSEYRREPLERPVRAAVPVAVGVGGPGVDEPVPADDMPEEIRGPLLLPKFSSVPASAVETLEAESGHVRVMLAPSGVGRASAADLAFGLVERKFGRPLRPDGSGGNSRVVARCAMLLPTERFVMDVMVPKGSLGQDGKAWATIYARFFELEAARPDRWHLERLPFDEQAEPLAKDLGENLSRIDEAGAPGYRTFLGHALKKMGWEGREFDAFRVRFEYPVLHSAVYMTVGQPDEPVAPKA